MGDITAALLLGKTEVQIKWKHSEEGCKEGRHVSSSLYASRRISRVFTSYFSFLCVFLYMSGNKPEGPAFKKPKKKKAPRLQPKQKSAFKKSKPKPKSKPLPKLKVNPLQKSKLKPKLKTRNFPQNQKLTHYKPFLMSSGAPSASGTSRPKSLKPQVQPRAKSKSRRTTSQKQNLSRSRPPQPKSKRQLKLLLKSKSRQTFSKYQNTSQSGTLLPRTHHTPQFRLQLFQPVWDTSVQAAIRVGDWKLLTGDPGHGDWVPQQVPQHM